MKNPCKGIDIHWKGYPTTKGCDICGDKPAKIEPRFLYVTCDQHDWINPFRFQRIVNGEEPDPIDSYN